MQESASFRTAVIAKLPQLVQMDAEKATRLTVEYFAQDNDRSVTYVYSSI